MIKTNPIGMAFGNFNLTYEKTLGTTSSVLISGYYWYKLFSVDVNIGGAGLGYRYYFTHQNKPVPAGFYITPNVAFLFGRGDADDNTTLIRAGAEIGYQWVWSSGFALDLGIGPSYYFNKDEELRGILPSATLAIGFAF